MKEVEYVVAGAILTCTRGTALAQLKVISQSGVFISDSPMATVMDKAPIINIPSFGTCKMGAYPPPCMPSPIAWEDYSDGVSVAGFDALLQTSSIKCAMGGCIKIKHSGQFQAHKVVTGAVSPQIRTQIETLKRAAKENTPFCEECEKKQSAIRLVDAYWEDNEGKRYYEAVSEISLTLYVETVNFKAGEPFSITLKNDEGLKYKGGKNSLKIAGTVNDKGLMIVKNFKIEYQN